MDNQYLQWSYCPVCGGRRLRDRDIEARFYAIIIRFKRVCSSRFFTDAVIMPNNNLVSDLAVLMTRLINELDNVIETKSNQSLFC